MARTVRLTRPVDARWTTCAHAGEVACRADYRPPGLSSSDGRPDEPEDVPGLVA